MMDKHARCLEPGALDRLMPMHLQLDDDGRIAHAGPTVSRLCAHCDLRGKNFLKVFEIRRPVHNPATLQELAAACARPLHLVFRTNADLALKGILVPTPDSGGAVVNLSFGLSVIEAVSRFELTNGDFAATDLAVEMLYLVEAKNAVMEESRRLNERLQAARVAAETLAVTDTLTGLRNRRALDQVFTRLLSRAMPFGLLNVDLDFFKSVNDTHGHAAGDHVLQVAASILKEATREGDTVARVGGDEFVLIFENLVNADRLLSIANRIIERLEEPIAFEDITCRISGSVGVSTSTLYDPPDLDRMLSDVDAALYESKRNGRGKATLVTADILARARAGTLSGVDARAG